MTRNQRAGCLVSAILFVFMVVQTASAEMHPPDARCAQVSLTVVRGSGERGPGTPGWVATRNDPGYGKTLSVVVAELMRRSVDLDVEVSSLPYPATAVGAMAPSPTEIADIVIRGPVAGPPRLISVTNTRIRTYMAGIATGVRRLTTGVIARSEACPQMRFIFVGYSQGAMVVHRTLSRIDGLRRPLLRRVDSVTLVADGDRKSYSSTDILGLPPAAEGAEGIAQTLPRGGAGGDIPSEVSSKTLNICTAHDFVCYFRGRGVPWVVQGAWRPGILGTVSLTRRIKTAIGIHTGYAGTASVFLVRAGQVAVSRTRPNVVPLAASGSYDNHLVQWDGDTKAQKTSWVVLHGRRYWVPDAYSWSCWKSRGLQGPVPLSSSVLDSLPDQVGSLGGRCVPTAASMESHIVQWSGDTKTQKTSWLVGPDGARRWISDTSTYSCLKGRGAPGPDLLPGYALDTLPDKAGVWAVCDDERIGRDSMLQRGFDLRSANGKYHLELQAGDGNLVLYSPSGRACWATNRYGANGADFLILQTDGNLVAYQRGGRVIWATDRLGGQWFYVQNDGNMVVYGASGAVLWASNTVGCA